jgi:hypothetical protein
MKKIHLKRSLRIPLLIFYVAVSSSLSAQNCFSAPGNNTAVASSTQVCAGANLTFSLVNTYTNTGLTYQWVYSTSSQFGPWNVIGSATGSVLNTNTLTISGYYTAVITCTSVNATTTANAVYVMINTPGTTTVPPYYQGFNALPANNVLPNCSWSASNLGGTCLTFSAGNGRAAFSASTTGTDYFYTEGFNFLPGITYSVSFYYFVSPPSSGWSNLSLLIGPGQSPVGQSTLISEPSPSSGSAVFKSTVFTVNSAGVYYLSMRATCTTTNNALLNWDDLFVVIPCTSVYNSPTVSVSPNTLTVCTGANTQYTFTASGADTYSWSNGATGSVAVLNSITSPGITNFSVTGTNTLSGCTSTAAIQISVNPSPSFFAIADKPLVCAGEKAQITLYGIASTNSVVWSTGQTTSVIAVYPTVTTVYSATITSINGCSTTGSFQVLVMPGPSVVITYPLSDICEGEQVVLMASGGQFYQWQGFPAGATISFTASSGKVYSLTATGTNGCPKTETVSLNVIACLNLDNNNFDQIRFYPNPASETIFVDGVAAGTRLTITDITGKFILGKRLERGSTKLQVSELQPGIYFIVFHSGEKQFTFKFQKE